MLNKLKYLVVPVSFFVGVFFADDVKGLRSSFHYTPQEGFYCKPYDLRVERKNFNGKVEVYLTDVGLGCSHKIGPKMFVGSPSHRINSVINIPKEYATKKNLKGLSSLIELYGSIFD